MTVAVPVMNQEKPLVLFLLFPPFFFFFPGVGVSLLWWLIYMIANIFQKWLCESETNDLLVTLFSADRIFPERCGKLYSWAFGFFIIIQAEVPEAYGGF